MDFGDFNTQIKGLTDRIDAMQLRERAMIFITVLVVFYFLAANLLFGPLNKENNRLQEQIDQKRSQAQAMEAQIQGLVEGGVQDPDADKRQQIQALMEKMKQMDQSLAEVTTGLVPPKEMARLVEQMLLKNRGLHVLQLVSIPATPLVEEGQKVSDSDTVVYKHGMRIQLKGRYMDILRYLKQLEGLPWKVFWGQATLKTEQYPDSSFNLLIYTLSTHEGWIGL